MRSLIAGLALTLCVTAPTEADVIQLALGSVPYAFSTQTNQFTGAGASCCGDDFNASAELRAHFDQAGQLLNGQIELHAPDSNALLLRGAITGSPAVFEIEGDHFFLQFPLTFTVDHLPGEWVSGSWWAYVCSPPETPGDSDCEGDGPLTAAQLFTTDYTHANVPLNSYLFANVVGIPSPPTAVLLFVGLGAFLVAFPVFLVERLL
jgi:hypothetical protein